MFKIIANLLLRSLLLLVVILRLLLNEVIRWVHPQELNHLLSGNVLSGLELNQG